MHLLICISLCIHSCVFYVIIIVILFPSKYIQKVAWFLSEKSALVSVSSRVRWKGKICSYPEGCFLGFRAPLLRISAGDIHNFTPQMSFRGITNYDSYKILYFWHQIHSFLNPGMLGPDPNRSLKWLQGAIWHSLVQIKVGGTVSPSFSMCSNCCLIELQLPPWVCMNALQSDSESEIYIRKKAIYMGIKLSTVSGLAWNIALRGELGRLCSDTIFSVQFNLFI